MLINVRGTFGSGKSTIIGKALDLGHMSKTVLLATDRVSSPTVAQPNRFRERELRGRVGPEAVALGEYRANCGGCDEFSWKGAHDAIVAAIWKAVDIRPRVLFEGVTISGIYGRYVDLANQIHEKTGRKTHVVFAMPPAEECVRRVALRSGRGVTERMTESVTDKWRSVHRASEKMRADNHPGIVIHYCNTTEDAGATVLSLLGGSL